MQGKIEICLRRLGIPQERIALCLGVPQQTSANRLPKMAVLPNPANTELKQDFTVPQIAEKHAWVDLTYYFHNPFQHM